MYAFLKHPAHLHQYMYKYFKYGPLIGRTPLFLSGLAFACFESSFFLSFFLNLLIQSAILLDDLIVVLEQLDTLERA